MTHAVHGNARVWDSSLALTLIVVVTACVYVRWWWSRRSPSSASADRWRAVSFLSGLLLAWIAVASPIAARDAELLTFHMIQHLLLMTFAAPLLLLGLPSTGRAFRPRIRATRAGALACWCAG